MSKFSLRYPYFIIVGCLMSVVLGLSSLVRMPVDLFPNINIPVVVVATFYSGMPPEQIEADITSRFERAFTLASNIDHMESRSLPGVSLVKIYFKPGSNPDSAVTGISNLAMASLRRLPRGTLPPVIMKFDASSMPVCLITFKGEGLNEKQLYDLARFTVRNQVASVPGASVPQPFGGTIRQIQVYVDPAKLQTYDMSVMDVVRSVNDANLILPAGQVRVGNSTYSLYTNSQLPTMEAINDLPVKTDGQNSVMVADIGHAADATAIQTNVVRVDGQHSVYVPILKQGGDTNTISVVEGVKNIVGKLLDVPESLITNVVFDQSVYVKSAIENLLHEGAIGLLLTGLMILIFLGNARATGAVMLSIPLSALVTFFILFAGGSSVNTMILGGLALAFSRLIDNSVIVLENIFRHLEMGEPPEVAAQEGGREVALPVLAATLTTAIVFFPVTFLYGVSQFLFSALALSVVISLFASYIVAMTVVPLFCAKFIKAPHEHEPHRPSEAITGPLSWYARYRYVGEQFNFWFNERFNRFLNHYQQLLERFLKKPGLTVAGIAGIFALSLGLFPLLGISFFPRTDPGQFVIMLKAPSGMRIEATEQQVASLENLVRGVVSREDLRMILSNIGSVPDLPAIYTTNSSENTAFVQVSLNDEHRIGSYEYMQQVREAIAREMPQLSVYLQAGGLVDSVVNLGLPAPIDVQIGTRDMKVAHTVLGELADKIRKIPGVSDVFTPQSLNLPALEIDVDRVRAAQLGLTQKEVINNLITALTSDAMIAPTFWIDPKSGNDYMLTVQYPENRVKSITDLEQLALRGKNASATTTLGAVATVRRISSPNEVDHYQLRRVLDIYVAPRGEDLGAIASAVSRIIAETDLPKGVTVDMRGSVQGMWASFSSFGTGLALAVVLVYLILVAQFRSFVDPLIILLAVPTGLTGVLLMLCSAGTTLNVMSLMGVVMMSGIVVSNSILIVEFTKHLCDEGMTVHEAVGLACRVRLRPVLMTSLATIIGLIPMAMKLGTGSESYAPLAQAIIGGLSVSVVLTVFVVPAAYLLIYGRKQHKRSDDPGMPAADSKELEVTG
ncbi:MAG: efflux RND transporter permease subunit [Methylococcales bacterium]|nr:efflux RND transporter permease subunit [Methylococcales bacterium]